MKNISVRWRIIASFAITLLVMGGSAAIEYAHLLRIEAETSQAEHSAVVALADALAVSRAWSESLHATTQQVSDGDLRRVTNRVDESGDDLSRLIEKAESTVTREAIPVLERFKSAHVSYREAQQGLQAVAGNPQQSTAIVNGQLLPAYERGEAAIYSLIELQGKQVTESMEQLRTDVAAAVGTTKRDLLVNLAIAFVLSALGGVGLMFAITRPLANLRAVVEVMRAGDFTRRVSLVRHDEFGALGTGFNAMADDLARLVGQVKESGLKVSTSVTEIAATAREQQATANEVAATTAEIGATSREISATSKELVRTMNEVSAAAEQSATTAGNGQNGLLVMEQSMRNVIDAAGSVNARLAALNEKAGDIGQVVVTITKVADQTNLLSLNAAIEAEKAGEYGRGFSVVATEIRRLADQTAASTHDIDRMVKAMQSAVSSGVMSMDKFSEEVRRGMQAVQEVGGQLSDVIQHTQALAPRFEAVTEGMQAQATGAEQITESLTQLSEAARQTVDSLRQSNAAIEDLNQVALGLRSGVSKFTVQSA
jgi:methyl-accepting chemotaxis protein WspA